MAQVKGWDQVFGLCEWRDRVGTTHQGNGSRDGHLGVKDARAAEPACGRRRVVDCLLCIHRWQPANDQCNYEREYAKYSPQIFPHVTSRDFELESGDRQHSFSGVNRKLFHAWPPVANRDLHASNLMPSIVEPTVRANVWWGQVPDSTGVLPTSSDALKPTASSTLIVPPVFSRCPPILSSVSDLFHLRIFLGTASG